MLKKTEKRINMNEWRIDKDWLIFAKPKFVEYNDNEMHAVQYEFYLKNENYSYIDHLITVDSSTINTVYLNMDNFVEIYLMGDINLYKNQLIRTNTLQENLIYTLDDIEYMIKNTPWECTNCQKAIDIIKELI